MISLEEDNAAFVVLQENLTHAASEYKKIYYSGQIDLTVPLTTISEC